jgi:hypothetical protein
MPPTSKILQDVVALVVCADRVHNAKAALQQRLQQHSARVLQRLSKEVTHVIFERRRSQRAGDKSEEEEKISQLYTRLDAVRLSSKIVAHVLDPPRLS